MSKPYSRIRWILGLAAAMVAVAQLPASAYIDPGTGSYVFQIVVGALVGAAVSLKVFWRHIFAFITRGRTRKG